MIDQVCVAVLRFQECFVYWIRKISYENNSGSFTKQYKTQAKTELWTLREDNRKPARLSWKKTALSDINTWEYPTI